jgi:hypothetical protein
MKKLIAIITEAPSGQLQANLTFNGMQMAFVSEEPDPEDRQTQKTIKATNFYAEVSHAMQSVVSPETCSEEFKKPYRLHLD